MSLDGTLGSIEPGKRADLVVVDGDPLDLDHLGKRIRTVYQDGIPTARPQQPAEASFQPPDGSRDETQPQWLTRARWSGRSSGVL